MNSTINFLLLTSLQTTLNYTYCLKAENSLQKQPSVFQNLQHFAVEAQFYSCTDPTPTKFAYYDVYQHAYLIDNKIASYQPSKDFMLEIRKVVNLKFNLWKFCMQINDFNVKYYNYQKRLQRDSETEKTVSIQSYIYNNANLLIQFENLYEILAIWNLNFTLLQFNISFDLDKQLEYAYNQFLKESEKLDLSNLNIIQKEFLDFLVKTVKNQSFQPSFSILEFKNYNGLIYSSWDLYNYVKHGVFQVKNINMIKLQRNQRNLVSYQEIVPNLRKISTLKVKNSCIEFIFNEVLDFSCEIDGRNCDLEMILVGEVTVQINGINQIIIARNQLPLWRILSQHSPIFNYFNLFETQSIIYKKNIGEHDIKMYNQIVFFSKNDKKFNYPIQFNQQGNLIKFSQKLELIFCNQKQQTLLQNANYSITLPNEEGQLFAIINQNYIKINITSLYQIEYTVVSIIYNSQLITEINFKNPFSGIIMVFISNQKQNIYNVTEQTLVQIIIDQFATTYTFILSTEQGFNNFDVLFDELENIEPEIRLQQYSQNVADNKLIKTGYAENQVATTKYSFDEQIVKNSQFVIDLALTQLVIITIFIIIKVKLK
ncbi:hypothetical protein SS50377_20288 [Spironucleus salmonicida]|uniref:Transmembrane protein n=1 Tax=Spironucleus salmonicida TaxID=348837 RepID=V6LLB2_9EUKA|nr:hypothetical protein SS50377_20288 [Spironucleus salmonicida]|eukprot:EST45342.1 Hypothetical protein SS50377_14921 [Spironucleus salmonicida]